jgi:hypothetical protein
MNMATQSPYQRNTYRTDPMATANDRLTYMDSLEENLADLHQRGFTSEFCVLDGRLYSYTSGKYYNQDEVKVTDYYRYEGISNPDDMSILFAIETSSGERGTLIDAYGIYADDNIGSFMQQVKLHKVLA